MQKHTDFYKYEISPGFGSRLKEERKRLGLNQAEFAQLANVKRLAQSQYENETTGPSIRYLSSIAEGGVDLLYLLFGKRQAKPLQPEIERQIKIRAFSLLENYVQTQCNGQLGPEARVVIFEVIMSLLANAANKGADTNDDEVLELLSHGR